jgi:hypothetical protein
LIDWLIAVFSGNTDVVSLDDVMEASQPIIADQSNDSEDVSDDVSEDAEQGHNTQKKQACVYHIITSYHITSYHIMSHHLISYNVTFDQLNQPNFFFPPRAGCLTINCISMHSYAQHHTTRHKTKTNNTCARI